MSTMVASSKEPLPDTTGMASAWTTLSINQSMNGIPDNCLILGLDATIPWDNPRNLISRETELLVERLKSAIFIPILYLVGAPANVVNMVVFFRQGIGKRINMCLFSLALIDLISLTVILFFYVERIYTQFTSNEKYGSLYRYLVNNNVIGIIGFFNGSVLMAAIISTERCICVLFPLQAQRCIPTKVLAIAIVVSVLLLVSLRFVVTAQYQITCFYELRTQRKSWQAYVTDFHFQYKDMLNVLGGLFFGFFISVGIPIIVLITAIITAVRLQQIVRWRSQTTSQISNAKEITVTKMLIVLSTEFFVLSIPVIVLRLLPVFQPQFKAFGRYSNTFFVLVGFAELCHYVSSSVNFFVYYFTSAAYRETLHGLIGRKTAKKIGRGKVTSAATGTNVTSVATGTNVTSVATGTSSFVGSEADTRTEQRGVSQTDTDLDH